MIALISWDHKSFYIYLLQQSDWESLMSDHPDLSPTELLCEIPEGMAQNFYSLDSLRRHCQSNAISFESLRFDEIGMQY